MSYTRATLRDTIRTILTDKTIFRDALINIWINDAIRDYSFYFPLEKVAIIDLVVAQKSYSLATYAPILGIISVVYIETGVEPYEYLVRRDFKSPNFYENKVYDLIDGSPPYLNIGFSPTSASYDISLRYHTVHTILTADADTLTVPDEHCEALRLYVLWKAAELVESMADNEPPRKAALLNALGGNSKSAEYAYSYKIRSLQGPAPHSRIVGPWSMDKNDRVY